MELKIKKFLQAMLICYLVGISSFTVADTDPWLEEMKSAVGLSVGDLEPIQIDFDDPQSTVAGEEDSNKTKTDIVKTEPNVPIKPDSLDPKDKVVKSYISEWLTHAKPPENAVPGNNFHYDEFGRMVGTGAGMKTIQSGTHDTVDYGSGTTSEEKVWAELRKKLDSIDHCTMEEYVVAKLSGKSISHCAGRYGAVRNLKGMSLATAKAVVGAAGYRCAPPIGGPPAKKQELAGTIHKQKPGPEQYLRKGQIVELVVYGPYSPPLMTVPDLSGESLKVVKSRLKEKGLKVKPAGTGPAPTKDLSGKAKESKPPQGSKVAPGTEIEVVFFGPYVPPLVTVPDVSGDTLAEVRSKLKGKGLKVKPAGTGPAPTKDLSGTAKESKPPQGSKVAPGAEIEVVFYGLYVPPLVTVPDVMGKSFIKAKWKLRAKGLKARLADSGPAPSSDLSNKVKESKPKAGAKVMPGIYVHLYTYGEYVPTKEDRVASADCSEYQGTTPYWNESKGGVWCRCPKGSVLQNNRCVKPPLVTVPSVVGDTLKEAKRKLRKKGLKVKDHVVNAGFATLSNLSNRIKKSEPSANSEVTPGTTVTLWQYGPYQPTKEEQVANADCSHVRGSRAYWDEDKGKPMCECPVGLRMNMNSSACITQDYFTRHWCKKNMPGHISIRKSDGTYGCIPSQETANAWCNKNNSGSGWVAKNIKEDGTFDCIHPQRAANAECDRINNAIGHTATNFREDGTFDCMPSQQIANDTCNRINTGTGWIATGIKSNGMFNCINPGQIAEDLVNAVKQIQRGKGSPVTLEDNPVGAGPRTWGQSAD